MEILEKLNKDYDNKFNYLKLLNVVYDKDALSCTITLLYPYQIDEISIEDREEIAKFFQEFLSLSSQVIVKYKKSFLDEQLIVDEVVAFFEQNRKGLMPYIAKSNISSSYSGQNVNIKVKLNQDVLSIVDNHQLEGEIKSHIESMFIANVKVELIENEEILEDEIIADDIIPITQKARRYEVRVEKKIIGSDIIPKPEFIADIKSPKQAVILSGFLSNKNRKNFIQKKGKNVGKEKALYTFNLRDSGGSIDCVYFCGKTHEKDMEALDDLFMLLCVGNVEIGLNGKLTYYIRKISTASPIGEIIEQRTESKEVFKHKKVVYPEPMPSKKQSNLFDEKIEYNDYIMNNTFVVFDIETTGLDPENCEITELGAIKIEKGIVTEKFSSFAKPSHPIPQEVIDITHITNEMVENAPRAEDVVYDFYEWSKGCILSGYNVIGFDIKFIRKIASKIGIEFENEIIDTMTVARQSGIRVTNYKLGTVVKALGLTLVDAHRAYNDAHATALVLLELNKTKNSK